MQVIFEYQVHLDTVKVSDGNIYKGSLPLIVCVRVHLCVCVCMCVTCSAGRALNGCGGVYGRHLFSTLVEKTFQKYEGIQISFC